MKLLSWINKSRRLLVFFGSLVISCAVLLAGVLFVLNHFPSVGAYTADALRGIFGDKVIAKAETTVFNAQDKVNQAEYSLGLAKPSDPWMGESQSPTPTPLPTVKIDPKGNPLTDLPLPGETAVPSWKPPAVVAFMNLEGEGVWQPYLKDPTGRVVAYRTFLHPDATRPYAVVAVVAFNLEQTRLHLVLGTDEPYDSAVTLRSNGKITTSDQVPGELLAAFNGGFKVEQGHFGAMARGLQAVPPRDGLATLGFYRDGTIRLGEWGVDIQPAADLVGYRQNGLLIIKNGSPTLEVNDPKYWGYTINWETVTMRSGLGLDKDSKFLYYFAGQSLSISTLAKAMKAVGVANALQLDINNYWVHFESYLVWNDHLIPKPLFPKEMGDGVGRYLKAFSRDYFYVTTLQN